MARVIDQLWVNIGTRVDTRNIRKLEGAIERARNKVNSMANATLRIGGALTAAAAGPIVEFARFEAELAKIEGLVGVSRDQLEAWKDDIAAIARETGQSPMALAEALFFVTSAGLRGSVAMDVLRASARAAAAGLGDQKSIVDLATSAINAYGEENLSAEEAVDHLVEAVRLGKLAPETLATAMGRALPVASAMGVQFSEVAGILAAMSRTGTNAEEGVTQLNAVMTGLLKPADSAKKALARVGLSVEDLREMAAGPQGLWGALRTLHTAFDGNIDAMAEVYPNVRALRGVFDLLGAGLEDNEALLQEMSDSTGVTDEAFDAMARTLMFQWKRAVATARTAMVELGAQMAPTAEAVIGFVQGALDWFRQLSPETKELVAQVLALGPVVLGAGVALKGLAFAMGGLLVVLKAARVAMVAYKAIQWAVNAAMLANPIGLLVAALAALVGAVIGAIIYWDEIVSAIEWAGVAFAQLLRDWGTPVDGIFSWITDAWNAVTAWLSGPEDGQSVISWLWQGVTGIFDWIFTAWWNVVNFLLTPVTGLLDWLGLPTEGIFDWITNALDSAIAYIRSIDLAETGRALLDSLVAGVTGAKDAVVESVTGVLQGVRDLLPFSDARTGPLSRLTESGRAIVSTLAEGTRQAQPLAVALVAGALTLPAVDTLAAEVQPELAAMQGAVDVDAQAPALDPVQALLDLIPTVPSVNPIQGLLDLIPEIDGTPTVDAMTVDIQGAAPAVDPVQALLDLIPTVPAVDPVQALLDLIPETPVLDTLMADIQAMAPDMEPLQALLHLIPDIQAIEDMTAPLTPGPVAAAGGGGSSVDNRSNTVSMTFSSGAIQITADGGDPREIAGRVEEELREYMRAGVEQLDSRLEA